MHDATQPTDSMAVKSVSIDAALAAADNRGAEFSRYSHPELLDIFGGLAPPSVSDFQGEFFGRTLASIDTVGAVVTWASTHLPLPGRWFGKGFTATGEHGGHGYNRFSFLGLESHTMRFDTRLDRSSIDDKPILLMDYGPKANPLAYLRARDEIRQIDDMNYLLCGYFTWPLIGRSQVFTYHLYGPVGPFEHAGRLLGSGT